MKLPYQYLLFGMYRREQLLCLSKAYLTPQSPVFLAAPLALMILECPAFLAGRLLRLRLEQYFENPDYLESLAGRLRHLSL